MSEPAKDFASTLRPRDESPIRVDRWPSEIPLLIVTAIISITIWLLAAISIFGLFYALLLATFFFVGHVVFVAHVRGNGVRLAADQFPELHHAVERLAQRMNLTPVPEAYLMQAGGTLNAFAAKFLRSNIVVLYSDLLNACGEDYAARDMIIAHELGHIKAGHLRWTWFLLPGSLVPFLGTALSRAREYTCDRYGLAGAGRRDSALLGLAILAAGGSHGPFVNREAMVRQREQLNTGWMRIGEWLTTHPPLSHRMAALDPALDAIAGPTTAGTLRAVAIILVACATPVAAALLAVTALIGAGTWLAGAQAAGHPGDDPAAALEALLREQPAAGSGVLQTAATQDTPAAEAQPDQPAQAVNVEQELTTIQARMGLEKLAHVIELEAMAGNRPLTAETLYARFAARNPGDSELRDPFDGERFGYEPMDGYYVLRSAGPDKVRGTADDVVRDSRRR